VIFRPLVAADQALLWDLLHVALWDPPPAPLRPRSVLQSPHVRIYAEAWGTPTDVGIVALASTTGPVLGACWMRLLHGGQGLGYVDDATPQLGIALFPEHQHHGYGELVMRAALAAAAAAGYRRVALTVHPENPAIRLYRRCGFREAGLRDAYHLMIASLLTPPVS
jgi:ribosomal protein S18 acetylase RimI-like enzyme